MRDPSMISSPGCSMPLAAPNVAARPATKNARSRRGLRAATSLTAASLTLALPMAASAGQVQQITSFGANPTGIGMYLYTPSNVAAKPAVLVGVHACHGKGTDVCTQGGGWVAQADKYGFLLICPSAVSADGCWDVHSTADLTHNGGGDASGIIAMVNYVLQNKNGDSSRVYVAGHSSGGMMTNVLLGSYPDVFKAGAAFAGVAFGCFAVGSVDSLGWNASCATGNVTETGAQWGDMVRAASPAFTGVRPRIQLWHGTLDATVNFHNFGEEIKEWTNVLGVSATPTSTENNSIQPTWVRTRYTDGSGVVQVEAVQETGQPHNLVVDQAEAIRFFGLDGTAVGPDGGASDGFRGRPRGRGRFRRRNRHEWLDDRKRGRWRRGDERRGLGQRRQRGRRTAIGCRGSDDGRGLRLGGLGRRSGKWSFGQRNRQQRQWSFRRLERARLRRGRRLLDDERSRHGARLVAIVAADGRGLVPMGPAAPRPPLKQARGNRNASFFAPLTLQCRASPSDTRIERV